MSTHLDYSAQMNTLRSVVTTLGDPNTKDDIKLKAAQELSEHFEVITQCPGYQTFLEHSMKIFIKILKDGDPHFITESHIQQVCEYLQLTILFNYLLWNWLNIKGEKADTGNDTPSAHIWNSSSICQTHSHVNANAFKNRQRRKCSGLFTNHHWTAQTIPTRI